MKKLILFVTLLTFGYLSAYSQGCGQPLASSGGQQFGHCGQIYTIHFSNTTNCNLEIWWNYFTDCPTEHLIPSNGGVNYAIPPGTQPTARLTHKVYEIATIFNDDSPTCDPSSCTPPCYLIVSLGGSNFVVPTNTQFGPSLSGGTYVGWGNCGGVPISVTFTQTGPNTWNIDFF